ncbi:MAG: SufS family cysteine desulfurase [Verrucomicrobiota bacterium]|nr:SufS family cysteine desulfurase [Verrucomicrobiota bacterium]
MNIEKIRDDFPILSRHNRGLPFAYLDNAATSQKPSIVIDSIKNYYASSNSNVHRGVYELAEEAEHLYHNSRKFISQYFNASEKETIFVRGATEGLNLIAHSYASNTLNQNDEIIVTEMEHHANIVPWQLVCQRTGAKLKVCPTLPDGSLDREWISKNISRESVKLISLTAISNTLGTINPVAEITTEAKSFGKTVVIDGAQSVPHQKTDFRKLGCDFFTFSGHKVFGPMGIGVVLGKEAILREMIPYQGGGDMIDQVSFEGTTFAPAPQKFEAGTPNVAGAIGLGKAIEYISQFSMEAIAQHEHLLYKTALRGLAEIAGFKEHGTTENKAAVLSFTIENIHPHDLATFLDAQGIAIRTGHHCCQPLMKVLGVEATARASFALYNTEDEAVRLVEAVKKAVSILR